MSIGNGDMSSASLSYRIERVDANNMEHRFRRAVISTISMAHAHFVTDTNPTRIQA